MKLPHATRRMLATCLAAASLVSTLAATSLAEPRYLLPNRRAELYNWHANYVHTEYNAPVALVVPPTANLQTNWSWGAASSRISRIDHQFTRDWPGFGPFGGGPYYHTPHWPRDTAQFGVYHVRGPWYPTQP